MREFVWYKTAAVVPNTSMLFKIKHLAKDYVLILIFGPLGFFRTIIKTFCFIVSCNNIYVNYFHKNLLNNLKNSLSYSSSVSYLNKLSVLHLFRGYRAIIRVIGVGYKIDLVKSNKLVIALGYSHKLNIQLPHFIKIHIMKKRTLLWSYSLKCLQEFCTYLFKLKKRDVYNGKGIIQPRFQKKLKIGKISRI